LEAKRREENEVAQKVLKAKEAEAELVETERREAEALEQVSSHPPMCAFSFCFRLDVHLTFTECCLMLTERSLVVP
jgi:hypothetical protein